MGRQAIFDIDIFQHREDLHGFSYASVLAKEAKDFERILDKKREKDRNKLVHIT